MQQCSICLDDLDELDALEWAPFDEFQSRAKLENAEDHLAPAPRDPLEPHRRSGRAPAPKVIADAPDERCPAKRKEAKRPRKGETPTVQRRTEDAYHKQNGKWGSRLFPGREFDDLDAYRAAKKQRAARRSAYLDQRRGHWR